MDHANLKIELQRAYQRALDLSRYNTSWSQFIRVVAYCRPGLSGRCVTRLGRRAWKSNTTRPRAGACPALSPGGANLFYDLC